MGQNKRKEYSTPEGRAAGVDFVQNFWGALFEGIASLISEAGKKKEEKTEETEETEEEKK